MKKDIYLAAGCFWGAERYLRAICGVTATEVGYANGGISHPTYREVSTDNTGYAETVHLTYETEAIGLERILQLYFKAIDPLSVNRQGEDVGTRYRTGIYYTDESDLPVIRRICERASEDLASPIAVEVKPLKNFYRAENEHQNYLEKHPGGYCHIPDSLVEFAKAASEPSTD